MQYATNILPRTNELNSIVIIKFKRRSQYKNDMYEGVRPELVIRILEYRKHDMISLKTTNEVSL